MASTTPPVARLSPLNFKGLIETTRIGLFPTAAKAARAQQREAPIQCWKCADCGDIHDDEEAAYDCCAPDAEVADTTLDRMQQGYLCPVCKADAYSHRDATDCCLWKDIDAPTRRAIADKVEAGASWADALGLEPKAVQA